VNIYIVQCIVYKSIVGKSINRRARTKEAVKRSATTPTKTYYKGWEFIASNFSSKDLSRDISRSKK